MKLKFRERKETKYIYLVYKDMQGMSFEEFHRKQVCKGEFDTGYHYYINDEGDISEDRNLSAIAGWDLVDNESSVYILVDAKNQKLNDAQFYEVNRLKAYIEEGYPNLEEVQINK